VLGRDVQLAPTSGGWSGIIGLDVDLAPGVYPVTVVVEPQQPPRLRGHYTLSVTAKKFRTRQLRVAPIYVEPPPQTVERILAEAARLDALFATATWRERVGPFQPPLDGVAADTFGARSIFNGRPRSPHGGVDYGCPVGTPIAAPAPAVVSLAEDLYFTGGTVVLDHGRGLYSVLAHLSSIAVVPGEVVERGKVVGAAGATGRVTGPHLHWGTRLHGARVDPLSLVAILAP
jgi:murein DD-endopeptidase MepM/ murein hydrolase activator NlpD